MTPDQMNAVNREQIRRAGARYTPGLDPNAPNIAVNEIAEAIAFLGAHNPRLSRIGELKQGIEDNTRWIPREIRDAFRRRLFTPEYVMTSLDRLAAAQPDGFAALVVLALSLASVANAFPASVSFNTDCGGSGGYSHRNSVTPYTAGSDTWGCSGKTKWVDMWYWTGSSWSGPYSATGTGYIYGAHVSGDKDVHGFHSIFDVYLHSAWTDNY